MADVTPPAAAPAPTAPAAPAAPAPAAAAAPAAPPAAPPRVRVQAPARPAPTAAAPAPAAPAAAAPAASAPDASKPNRAQVSARTAKELEDLRQFKKTASANTEALAGYAASALSELPANVADFIRETVGDDPAAQLRAVTNAKKKSLINPGTPPGANTAPAPGPATAEASAADPDVKVAKHHQSLIAAGKGRAADIYAEMNAERLERGLKKIAPAATRTN
jgi:hypothetical protein